MNLRYVLTALLAAAVAVPAAFASNPAPRFPDVPVGHRYSVAVEWAADPENFGGAALFRGFPDGRFGPGQELTEGQFAKVVERLFDSADRWTRAETAELLYRGYPALRESSLGAPPWNLPGSPDGRLDCPPEMGGERVVAVVEHEPQAVGVRTPFDALVKAADSFVSRYGAVHYGVHVVDARTGTITAGGREVALLKVRELPSGAFVVWKVERCPDFPVGR